MTYNYGILSQDEDLLVRDIGNINSKIENDAKHHWKETFVVNIISQNQMN